MIVATTSCDKSALRVYFVLKTVFTTYSSYPRPFLSFVLCSFGTGSVGRVCRVHCQLDDVGFYMPTGELSFFAQRSGNPTAPTPLEQFGVVVSWIFDGGQARRSLN